MQQPVSTAGTRRGSADAFLQHRTNGIAERWIRVLLCLIGMSSVTLAGAQVVQPPEPVDPSPINGEMYYLINQALRPANGLE